MKKSIIIIGAGMGGLATGIYGQRNGFSTTIFEAHHLPGGQCASWNRKGYVFDGCIHHWGGGSPQTRIEAFWRELGAQPCEKAEINECISAVFPDGTYVHDYNNLEKLAAHLKQLAPEDSAVIDDYLAGIRGLEKDDTMGVLFMGSGREKLSALPAILGLFKYFPYTLETYARRFKSPLLRKVFPLLHYSAPDFPLFLHLVKHAVILKGGIAWPRGGSAAVAGGMAARYQALGGTIRYRQKVAKILTENDRACGVELEDGTCHAADFVVSNADGRKTILQMLSGRYVDKNILKYCESDPDQDCPESVMVFLGVKRDLSSYPCAMLMFLEKPEVIAGHACDHLDLQVFGYDPSMAPSGKGVIKVELTTKPSYFSRFENGQAAYQAEKERIAEQVITLLEKHFPGLRGDIEVIDVATLRTWERFMNGTFGFNNRPNRELSILGDVFGLVTRDTLPGLKNFYLTGQWATNAGALIMNAKSGKTVVEKICKQVGVKFVSAS